jgi:hypothetical protein
MARSPGRVSDQPVRDIDRDYQLLLERVSYVFRFRTVPEREEWRAAIRARARADKMNVYGRGSPSETSRIRNPLPPHQGRQGLRRVIRRGAPRTYLAISTRPHEHGHALGAGRRRRTASSFSSLASREARRRVMPPRPASLGRAGLNSSSLGRSRVVRTAPGTARSRTSGTYRTPRTAQPCGSGMTTWV